MNYSVEKALNSGINQIQNYQRRTKLGKMLFVFKANPMNELLFQMMI